MSGPQQTLPQLTSFQTADTPARLDAFVARIHAYREYMDAITGILEDPLAILQNAYADEAFIHVGEAPPESKWASGSNAAFLSARFD